MRDREREGFERKGWHHAFSWAFLQNGAILSVRWEGANITGQVHYCFMAAHVGRSEKNRHRKVVFTWPPPPKKKKRWEGREEGHECVWAEGGQSVNVLMRQSEELSYLQAASANFATSVVFKMTLRRPTEFHNGRAWADGKTIVTCPIRRGVAFTRFQRSFIAVHHRTHVKCYANNDVKHRAARQWLLRSWSALTLTKSFWL